jgi:hypothetical protein
MMSLPRNFFTHLECVFSFDVNFVGQTFFSPFALLDATLTVVFDDGDGDDAFTFASSLSLSSSDVEIVLVGFFFLVTLISSSSSSEISIGVSSLSLSSSSSSSLSLGFVLVPFFVLLDAFDDPFFFVELFGDALFLFGVDVVVVDDDVDAFFGFALVSFEEGAVFCLGEADEATATVAFSPTPSLMVLFESLSDRCCCCLPAKNNNKGISETHSLVFAEESLPFGDAATAAAAATRLNDATFTGLLKTEAIDDVDVEVDGVILAFFSAPPYHTHNILTLTQEQTTDPIPMAMMSIKDHQ